MVSVGIQRGFTLVELVMVIVLMGIISGVLAPMIVQSITAYRDSQARADLVAKGRVALERLAREVRQAAPNSLRATGGGTGIEFVSSREGGRYVDLHDDFGTASYPANRRFKTNATLNQLDIIGTTYVHQGNDSLVIGNTSPGELQAGTTVSQISAAAPFDADGAGGDDSQTLTFANNQFPNDSPGKHFSIVDATYEIGLTGNTIRWHRATGITGYDGNAGWGGGDPILVDGVTTLSFDYSPGTPQSAGVLSIDLEITDGAEEIRLYHEVHVRNTP
jgi:MSHA biogenesis protein MshO